MIWRVRTLTVECECQLIRGTKTLHASHTDEISNCRRWTRLRRSAVDRVCEMFAGAQDDVACSGPAARHRRLWSQFISSVKRVERAIPQWRHWQRRVGAVALGRSGEARQTASPKYFMTNHRTRNWVWMNEPKVAYHNNLLLF